MKNRRIVPELPDADEKIRLIIDSDAANEIDDLYAISLALMSPDRFDIAGFNATHFAASESAGPDCILRSYEAIQTLQKLAGTDYPIKLGAHPMQYSGIAQDGEAVDFIIDEAHKASEDNPLWVLALGAATNPASAILKDPSIIPNIRYIFHARNEHNWPDRTDQYNVVGDVPAAAALLRSGVPLVWFDTGTHVTRSYTETAERIAPLGKLGKYLHDYRDRSESFKSSDKGFFDLADVAWMIQPEICDTEIVDVPSLKRSLYFQKHGLLGKMLRVSNVQPEACWKLLEKYLSRGLS